MSNFEQSWEAVAKEQAQEILRLDDINAKLLEALQDMGMRYGLTEIARAAIAKATQGETK